ncbi:hypothetical protein AQI88_29570 [Streptomyces cellostaticus]|uniref:Uncharacterized protein n=2 Tax=Streptomyces cellostaticus TaxID=67285 RepID=A0A101NH65_9ACTN|nr:hypothetical protein AQI88_29570 [Streptomyces cellostaticus]
MRARIRTMRQRVVSGVQSVPSRLRRWASAVDVWIQDHHIPVVIVLFALLGAAAGLLLWTSWDLVVLARQVAPILTIVSIVVSAFLGATGWFRKRRAARLARQGMETAGVPQPRTGETDAPTGSTMSGEVSGDV